MWQAKTYEANLVSVLASSLLSLGQRENWEFVSVNVGISLIDVVLG